VHERAICLAPRTRSIDGVADAQKRPPPSALERLTIASRGYTERPEVGARHVEVLHNSPRLRLIRLASC
jgi:hypothetical protein